VVITRIHRTDSEYPAALRRHLDAAPESATALGNLEVLTRPKLAIFCSTTCPEAIIPATEQVMRRIVAAGVTIISGFHSQVEKRCLKILLAGNQPVIVAPARSLDKLRIGPDYKQLLDQDRLLFLSFFRSHRHRSDVEMAFKRNLYAAALADRVLIVHASRSSKTEQLCREVIGWRKPVYTISNEANKNLVRIGAQVVSARNDSGWIRGLIVE
jgi:predicted Rossmann fold nucleotide-binding protein DprA/Smf involved in DNA uptake